MQVWILACIAFVFITVLEYTYILFLMRKSKQQSLQATNKKQAPAVAGNGHVVSSRRQSSKTVLVASANGHKVGALD